MSKLPVIAVVDDNEAFRRATMSFIRSLGYAVVQFASAEAFLKSDCLHETDCLISDVQMPGMNGVELQDKLIAQGHHLPIIFMTAFPGIQDRWVSIIWMVAALTMILGNVIAVSQTNIKRMLAYSSIAHAGYIAVAFASGSRRGVSAALFYLMAYSLTNLGAFSIVTILSRSEDKLTNLSDYAGLATKRPGLAALLTLFLLSLAGVPGTAGFAGKFFIFRSSVESGLVWLTVLGVVTTVVSFYYYLYVIVQMYMRNPTEEFADLRLPGSLRLALLIAAVGTLYLGILPTRLLDWSTVAALNALR